MRNNQKQQKKLFWKCVRKDKNIFANQQWHGARNYILSSRTKRRWSSMAHTLTQGVMTLTHLPLDKMSAISQTIFSDVLLSMKSFVFWLKFLWSLFLRVQLTIFHHEFRLWLGAEQTTSHYLNQRWPMMPTHICATRPQLVYSHIIGLTLLRRILLLTWLNFNPSMAPFKFGYG